DFANDDALVKEGANLYSTSQTANTAVGTTMRQGALEGSNVQPVIEISKMIEGMRAYEATATLSKAQEDLMRQAIQTLGLQPNEGEQIMRALSIASTGMQAQQTNVEVIANNLANMNTTAFKEQRAEFTDLLYQNIQTPGAQTSDQGTYAPNGIQLGAGVRTAAVYRIT